MSRKALLDKHGRPIPKKPSFREQVTSALSRVRKLVLWISGGLAVTVALVTNFDAVTAYLTPQKKPQARFTVLEETQSKITTQVWRNPWEVKHELKKTPENLRIIPKGLALDSYKVDNIVISSTIREYFAVEFPALDFLVSNASNTTVEIQELRVEVEESLPDLSPLFVAAPTCYDNTIEVQFQNDGWGPAENVQINLTVHTQPESPPAVTVRRSYSRILKGVNIEISSELAGVVNCTETQVWVAGTLEYSFLDAQEVKQRSMSIKSTKARNRRAAGGGPSPVTGEYDFALAEDKRSYSIQKSISHHIKAGESDHIVLRFAAPLTSRHRFRIFAKLDNGHTIDSEAIDAVIFLPRANAIRLQQNSGFITTVGSVSDEYFIDEYTGANNAN